MDNLTHSLVGLTLARAGLDRHTPRAAWLLVAASNAPDIDILSNVFGNLTYLDWHRQHTHALLLAPLLAVACVAFFRLVLRWAIPWRAGSLLALLAIGLHILMDLATVYGTRILLPFSRQWFAFDWIYVFDFTLFLVLAVAAVAPLLSRLVSGEIGARAGTPGRGLARFALLFLAALLASRWVLHDRALAVLNARIYNGANPQRIAALPSPLNPFVWRGLVRTADALSEHEVNLLAGFDPERGRVYAQPEPGPALTAARATPTMRRYLDFAQWPCFRMVPVDRPEGGVRVTAFDLRFGDGDHPRFVASVLLDAQHRVVEEAFSISSEP